MPQPPCCPENTPMMSTLFCRSLALAMIAVLPCASAQWTFDETTTGGDILWTSPSSVDSAAFAYDVGFQITLVEVGVEFLGLPLGTFDALDGIPPEDLGGVFSQAGPAPVTFVDDTFLVPLPPDPVTFAADLAAGVDGSGFGFINLTNVVLGTAVVDTGAPFGVQTVDIVSLRIGGTFDVVPTRWLDLGDGLAGTNGLPVLDADGTLVGGEALSLSLTNALADTTAFLTVGVAALNAPFKGGVLVPDINPPGFFFALPTGPAGTIVIPATWPAGFPPNFDTYYQYWIQDPAGPFGFAASNACQGRTP